MGDPFANPFETRPPRWDSAGERAQWLTRVASHVDALAKLLHVARGPIPRPPGVSLVYCGRCSHGPFEGRQCPECGESEDLPSWPAGATEHRGSAEHPPPRSPDARVVAPGARASSPAKGSLALPASSASPLAQPQGKPPKKRRRAKKGE
jgi:hypothetical protein